MGEQLGLGFDRRASRERQVDGWVRAGEIEARIRDDRRRRTTIFEDVIDLSTWEPKRLARATDHDSSHRAARQAVASGLVRRHEAKILAALEAARQPLTSEELAAATGLSTVQVCRRLGASELCAPGGRVEKIRLPGCRLRWRLR